VSMQDCYDSDDNTGDQRWKLDEDGYLQNKMIGLDSFSPSFFLSSDRDHSWAEPKSAIIQQWKFEDVCTVQDIQSDLEQYCHGTLAIASVTFSDLDKHIERAHSESKSAQWIDQQYGGVNSLGKWKFEMLTTPISAVSFYRYAPKPNADSDDAVPPGDDKKIEEAPCYTWLPPRDTIEGYVPQVDDDQATRWTMNLPGELFDVATLSYRYDKERNSVPMVELGFKPKQVDPDGQSIPWTF